MTVVTVLDNQKLLKPQVLKDGELEPFFKELKEVSTDEKGKNNFAVEAQDWTFKMSGFETEEDYLKAIKRPKTSGGGSGEDCVYNGTATASVGGIKAGKKFVDSTMQEMWDALLKPTTAPTAKISVSPTLCEKGKEVEITVSVNGTKGSSNITKYELSYDSQNISKTAAFTQNITISKTTIFTSKVTDSNGSNGSANATVRFCDRSYYGIIPKTLIAAAESNPQNYITEEMIKNLNSKLVGEASFKFENVNMKNERICYCYPSEFGTLSSAIIEGTPFNTLDSFILKKLKINNVDMNCYIQKGVGSLSGVYVEFSK